MRVRPIDYLLWKIWPALRGCGYEPLTFILSPCSTGEAKIPPARTFTILQCGGQRFDLRCSD